MLGGDASVAAGPAGRQSTASTDLQLKAEIYSYSRSRGAFLGVSLKGLHFSSTIARTRPTTARPSTPPSCQERACRCPSLP